MAKKNMGTNINTVDPRTINESVTTAKTIAVAPPTRPFFLP
jgi:hypothetical protein